MTFSYYYYYSLVFFHLLVSKLENFFFGCNFQFVLASSYFLSVNFSSHLFTSIIFQFILFLHNLLASVAICLLYLLFPYVSFIIYFSYDFQTFSSFFSSPGFLSIHYSLDFSSSLHLSSYSIIFFLSISLVTFIPSSHLYPAFLFLSTSYLSSLLINIGQRLVGRRQGGDWSEVGW